MKTTFRALGRSLVLSPLFPVGFGLLLGYGAAAQTNCTPAPSGLVDWWPADGFALDVVGTNNATLENGASYAPGEAGQAFSLSGSSSYVALPNNFFPYPTTGTGTQPFTFEVWFKTSSGGVIFAQQNGPAYSSTVNGTVPGLYVGTDGKLRAEMFWRGTISPIASPSAVNDGLFHHAAVTYDGSNEVLYLDGAAVASTNQFAQTAYASTYYYQLGTGTGSGMPGMTAGWYQFNGLIDEPSLYSRALTAHEVLSIYQAGSAGKCFTNNPAPVFVQQPLSESVGVAQAFTLTGAAMGSPRPQYQWLFNGAPLSGATSAALAFPYPTTNQSGTYALVASNEAGSVTSTSATIAIVFFPQATVWSEDFDDGNADDRWGADQGVWQIGSPTVGPQTNAAGCRAFSCPNCATTGLNGNYLPDQDSRFENITQTCPIVVPPASQFPSLRFWHWYSFGGQWWNQAANGGWGAWDEGSYGYVEIKAGTNDWTTVSPTYTGSSGGLWWPVSLDLTPYAGQAIQVAFHFHSAHNTDVGWYVDDVSLVSGTPAALTSPEGFEQGPDGWDYEYAGANCPTWQIGVPQGGPGSAHSGTNCAATMLSGTCCSYSDSRLFSPQFTVSASNSYPRLCFWHWYSFAGQWWDQAANGGWGAWDEGSYGYVEVKAGTNDWTQVTPTYSGSSGGLWWPASIDLMPYAGQVVQVAFHFHSAHNTGPGWYVDDVAVVSAPPVPLTSPEGFEQGPDGWNYDYAGANCPTWQVGVPEGGPGSAHSGTNCAATMLSGTCCSYSDSRLFSPQFTVSASNSYPRLCFWHWYSFAGQWWNQAANGGWGAWDEGSYGYVEIKAGTNDWTQISPTYTGSSGSLWWQASIDLMPYAGQAAQVAFHFHSAHNTGPGWYVDDVAVVSAPPVPLTSPEGFEQGPDGWDYDYAGANCPTWQVGVPEGGPGSAHSGTNCAATMLSGMCCGYCDSRLVSPAFVAPAGGALRFWHWYSFAGQWWNQAANGGWGAWDEGSYGHVEIKAGTNDWATLPDAAYTGQSGGWTEPLPFDLSSYVGQTVQIAFHFHSAYNTAPGWYVDDIQVLNYTSPPAVTQPPASQAVVVSSRATFQVAAIGAQPLAYQWYSNNVAVAGGTSTTLTIPSVGMNDDGDDFFVVVTNSVGAATSAPAILTVLPWPQPWQTNIVNPTPTPVPAPVYNNGLMTVCGSGIGVEGTTGDSFSFFNQTLTGDGQIVARLLSLHEADPQGSDPLAAAGVMIRESLDPGSKHVLLAVQTNALIFGRRLATDDYSTSNSITAMNVNGGTPCWLRLMRLGNTFVGLYSGDGSNWVYGWFTTVNMSNQVLVGVAVTSHHEDGIATATLDNLAAGQLAPVTGWSGQKICLGGEGEGLAFWEPLGGFKMLFCGVPGDSFEVKASPSLNSPFPAWPSLETVTNTWGVVPFLDPGALTNNSRFYGAQRIGP
jgi:hypothetical protein